MTRRQAAESANREFPEAMQPEYEDSLMHKREAAGPVVPRGQHGAWLAMSLAVPVIALLLIVIDDERIAFRFLPRQTFPEVCWSRSFFGILCPLCGMTRSVVYLCHGDWEASLAMHRLGGMILFTRSTQNISPDISGLLDRLKDETDERYKVDRDNRLQIVVECVRETQSQIEGPVRCRDIFKKLGVPRGTARHWLNEAVVAKRLRYDGVKGGYKVGSSGDGPFREVTEAQIVECTRAIENGRPASESDIAKELGTTVRRVRSQLKHAEKAGLVIAHNGRCWSGKLSDDRLVLID